jgi:hypothetical protein
MEDELVSDGCDDRFIWERKDLGKPLRLCRVPDVDGWGRQVPKETSSVRKRPAMWQNTPAMWQKRPMHTGGTWQKRPAECSVM